MELHGSDYTSMRVADLGVPGHRRSRPAVFAALAAARLNSRQLVDEVHKQMRSKPFACEHLYKAWRDAMRKLPRNMHTKRFNTRLVHAKNKAKAGRNFLIRAALFSRSMVKTPLGRLHKKKVSVDAARKFGTLTAKNAMLYLELYYPKRRPKALTGSGSLWGPGAKVGENVVAGKQIVSAGKPTQSLGDIIEGFEASHKLCNAMRRGFERGRCRFAGASVSHSGPTSEPSMCSGAGKCPYTPSTLYTPCAQYKASQ